MKTARRAIRRWRTERTHLRRAKRWFFRTSDFNRRKRGVWRETNVICSDPMCCGNPRRYMGDVTPQERKAELEYVEELREVSGEDPPPAN